MQSFPSKGDLMKQKKNDHFNKASSCWKYALRACEYGDQLCWFSHAKPVSSSKFTCNACDKTFSIQPEYFKHRKHAHTTSVPLCKNDKKGECKFSENDCWFIHDKSENEKFDKMEVMQKLFNIMENIR